MLLPVDLDLRTDEGDDGFGICLGTHDVQLVVKMEDGVAVGNAHMTVVQDA